MFTDEQGRGVINIESIGGNLIVQHYRPVATRNRVAVAQRTFAPGWE